MKKHTMFIERGCRAPDGIYTSAHEQLDYYVAADVDEYRNTSSDIILANCRELTRLADRINEMEKALRDLSAEWVNGRNVLDGCSKEVADRVRALLTKGQLLAAERNAKP